MELLREDQYRLGLVGEFVVKLQGTRQLMAKFGDFEVSPPRISQQFAEGDDLRACARGGQGRRRGELQPLVLGDGIAAIRSFSRAISSA